MKKIVQRLLIFFVGLPAVLVFLLCLPGAHHLAFSLLTLAGAVLGALEFRGILRGMVRDAAPGPVVAGALGGLCPLAAVLVVNLGLDPVVESLLFCLGAFGVLAAQAFATRAGLEGSLPRAVAGFALLIYPGFFLAWIIHLAALPDAGIVILFYLLIVFLNDSAAWAAGMLLGKSNKGLVPASPNKSVAGFVGGLAASVATGVLGAVLFPGVFPSVPRGALLGFAVGAAAVLGDLGESALKRSAGVKDSGGIIPGRGGVLDSIDSLALAAPVYGALFRLLF